MRHSRRLFNLVKGEPYLRAQAPAGVSQLFLYDEISPFGVMAADIVSELSELDGRDFELHVNSPGGDVFEGISILNNLRGYPGRITGYVDGIAASAASFILCGCDEVVMGRNSELMIHDAWGMCLGNASDMVDMARRLDKVSDNIASVYAGFRGAVDETETWRERMRQELWLSAEEAVDYGLADRVDNQPVRVDNAFDLSAFKNHKRTTVLDAACPMHTTATAEGQWDAGMNERHLPSPMPVATAKKMYAAYDDAAVADGKIPKSAGHLPHHIVSSDGTPGAASLAGVRNALARLPQTQGLSEAERSGAEKHLRHHLEATQNNAFTWDADEFRRAFEEA